MLTLDKCELCGRKMKNVSDNQVNLFVLILLVVLGVVPGLLYLVYMKLNDNYVCMHCVERDIKRIVGQR